MALRTGRGRSEQTLRIIANERKILRRKRLTAEFEADPLGSQVGQALLPGILNGIREGENARLDELIFPTVARPESTTAGQVVEKANQTASIVAGATFLALIVGSFLILKG